MTPREAGHSAFLVGDLLRANPHPAGSAARLQWHEGWYDGWNEWFFRKPESAPKVNEPAVRRTVTNITGSDE